MRAQINSRTRRWLPAVLGSALFFGLASPALAIPTLQLYVEGSTWDPAAETWVLEGSNQFTLWVLGDVGYNGSILDVRLSGTAATSEITAGGYVTIAPTTATGITDPSVSAVPTATANFPSLDGQRPQLGDGSYVPWHSEFGPGMSFFEWNLGDFTLTDSPIGDIAGTVPFAFTSTGQINAYTIGLHGLTSVHFDTYDHVLGGNSIKATKNSFAGSPTYRYVFAPFSHDAGATGATSVPEPDMLVLLGAALAGIAAIRRRRAE